MNKKEKLDEGEEVTVELNSPNPLFKTNLGWYFYDEQWQYIYGPFSSRDEANSSLKEYCLKYLQ